MEYLEGGATPLSQMLADNLKGLWYSCKNAAGALSRSGYSLTYIGRIAGTSYTVIAGSIAAKLGITLGTINFALGGYCYR